MMLSLRSLLMLSICLVVHQTTAAAKCRRADKSALLALRKTFVRDPWTFDNCTPYDWKESIDCCSFEGVKCRSSIGSVNSLTVSTHYERKCYEGISFSLLSNSSIFKISSLQILDLSYTNLRQSTIPSEIAKLTQLQSLKLILADLSGPIPETVGNLTNLEELDLSSNSLSGTIPRSIVNLKKLRTLNLCDCGLTGSIPSGIANLPNLESLELCRNSFAGTIPAGVFSHPQLRWVDLSSNQLQGSLPTVRSSNLSRLDLSNNRLYGAIPSSLFGLHSLYELNLSNNSLGPLQAFPKSADNLSYVDLGFNNITGPFPSSLFHLTNVFELNLQANQLTGDVEWNSFEEMQSLHSLTLSFNRGLDLKHTKGAPARISSFEKLYMKSCGVTEFPNFLGDLGSVSELDVSDNRINGAAFKEGGWKLLRFFNGSQNQITAFEYPSTVIEGFDLSHNLVQGSLPNPPPSLSILSLANNQLSGRIPTSYCNLKGLQILDLGHNKLDGVLPPCLINFSARLIVLNLENNRFHGVIPDNFEGSFDEFGRIRSVLSIVKFGNNNLEGPLPRSLSACFFLNVLDVGNNQITDTFPFWLGRPPGLFILILCSNRFHGSMDALPSEFFDLQILDVSSNNFTGPFPGAFLQKFSQLTNWPSTSLHSTFQIAELPSFNSIYRFIVSVDITVNGVKMKSYNALNTLTLLDFSDNQFSGPIPESIGDLRALKILSLSRNKLSGEIWSTIGEMSDLESLDLSENNLVGTIPYSLMKLKHLQFFNMSYNNLRGPIPPGKFSNASYIGNPGLCGAPLSKSC